MLRRSLVSGPAVIAAAAFVFLSALVLIAREVDSSEASLAGGMDAMSIDVDVTGNMATSLGPRDECVEAEPGDLVTVDVTATGIPPESSMIGFSYTILYNEARVWAETQSHEFLLAANVGSAVFNVSDPTPDQGVNYQWTGAAADISDWALIPPENGSGVLSRLGVSISQSAPQAIYSLTLTAAAYIDTLNEAHPPNVLNHAVIAVGTSCQSATPTSGPSATPPATLTPAPSGTPAATPAPSAPALSVRFEPQAYLRPSDSSVTIRGTFTCLIPMQVEVQVALQQFGKGEGVIASGPGEELVACSGQATWFAILQPDYGRFRPGEAEIVVLASSSASGGVGASGSLYLKPRPGR